RTKEIVSRLNFGSLPSDADSKSRPAMNPLLIGWILETLVSRRALEHRKDRNATRYSLTDDGEDLLGASDQYPTIPFKLTGKELSKLIDVARRSTVRLAPPASPQNPEETPTATSAPESSPPASTLTPQALMQEFDELRRGKYARTGLVPIYDLRQLIAT